MANPKREIILSDKAPKPIGAYSQAIKTNAESLMFIAGQVAIDLDGNIVGEGDVAAQVLQVYKNIGGVLRGVGASFQNVVEFTTYIVGRETFEQYSKARSEVFANVFPEGDYPPNTLLIISGLARPEFLVEIKAVVAL